MDLQREAFLLREGVLLELHTNGLTMHKEQLPNTDEVKNCDAWFTSEASRITFTKDVRRSSHRMHRRGIQTHRALEASYSAPL